MATPPRPRLRLLLVLLQEAPPPRLHRQSPAPPPFPREGPGIGAAPQGSRPDSRTLSRGAPYKGMVGAERAAAVSGPAPRARPPASEWRSSAPPQDHLSGAGSPHLWQAARASVKIPLTPVLTTGCSTFPLLTPPSDSEDPDNKNTPRNVGTPRPPDITAVCLVWHFLDLLCTRSLASICFLNK